MTREANETNKKAATRAALFVQFVDSAPAIRQPARRRPSQLPASAAVV
jgi:hypothetical protein